MAANVASVAELIGDKEKDKTFLFDAPMLLSGLFVTVVNLVVERFREAKV